MGREVLAEIMGRAIVELREALEADLVEVDPDQWDPDAFEQVVRQFTHELGKRMLQIWGEVRTEQAQAQAPFVLVVEDNATYTDGGPSGG